MVVFTKGEPVLWAMNSSGNASMPIKCKGSHQTKASDKQTYKRINQQTSQTYPINYL